MLNNDNKFTKMLTWNSEEKSIENFEITKIIMQNDDDDENDTKIISARLKTFHIASLKWLKLFRFTPM